MGVDEKMLFYNRTIPSYMPYIVKYLKKLYPLFNEKKRTRILTYEEFKSIHKRFTEFFNKIKNIANNTQVIVTDSSGNTIYTNIPNNLSEDTDWCATAIKEVQKQNKAT